MLDHPTKPRSDVVSGIVARGSAETVGPFAVGGHIAENYEIRGILGAGGMGVVYDGYDRALARRVAIKTALAKVFAASLRSEAHALAALRSSSFVEVFSLSCHEGIDFMVMEFLHGERLDRRVDDAIARGEHLLVGEVVDILIGIARALRIAHGAGISQRDLKPSNVFIAGERVVLFDFGLAVPEVFVEDTTMLSGSVDYLAPELILGNVKRGEGALVDLYALGICAYELLTNDLPFREDTAVGTLSRHLSHDAQDVRDFRSDLPTELASIVHGLLEKDPADRPASAEAVLWTLQALKTRIDQRACHPLAILAVARSMRAARALKAALESRVKHVVVEATADPSRALFSKSAFVPDLVLLDLDLPNHDCIETCASLLSEPRSLRPHVVGMGGCASRADLALLRALGMEQVLPKDAALLTELARIIARVRR